ncbi:MAG: NAD(P)(+) transhydrogenase (Re/Si-specific) subunit beta [Spirochaetia bacterium]|nr:NAD(P)(+) transhydrogenase (Re/Si-specific) subunit beta [Spirochaetia bacterium]
METKEIFIKLAYLASSLLFIFGIKQMGRTSSARSGNLYSAIAMLIAIVATLLDSKVLTFTEIIVGILIGSAIGTFASIRVPMTSMPEMVAIFNGVGGLASLFVAVSDYNYRFFENHHNLNEEGLAIILTSVVVSILIGAITFTGSYIAYAKLSGTIDGRAIMYRGQHVINLLLLLIAIFSGFMVVVAPMEHTIFLYILIGVSLLLGVLTVIPIGGADMPVVISLLNSYSGMAGCATGFVLNNPVLVISGALVGSSGIILTRIMCVAMNRSLVSVLLGGFGQVAGTDDGSSGPKMSIREIGVEETAMLFDSASSVIIIPGYGMAVAQAQHVVRELMNKLETKGVLVRFAIHPVAGRMPGHMNVLLAEAEVPYDKLIEMDEINSEFPNTDIVLIIGANDIVNPAARNNPKSPIYGMPILNADKAKTVIISKRSMAAGYAGIENELFGYENAFMLFGDAKSSIGKVNSEIDSLG